MIVVSLVVTGTVYLQISELLHHQYTCSLILSTNYSPWVRIEVEGNPCCKYIDATVFVRMLIL